MSKNRDADKIKHILKLVQTLKLNYEYLDPISEDELGKIRILRSTDSRTSPREIKKALPKGRQGGNDDQDQGKPTKPDRPPRLPGLNERRYLVAKTVKSFCYEFELVSFEQGHEPSWALFIVENRETLNSNESTITPIWSGSGRTLVVDFRKLENSPSVSISDIIVFLASLDLDEAEMSLELLYAPQEAWDNYYLEVRKYEYQKLQDI